MKCPECGRRNNNTDNFCVSCAASLSKISKDNKKIIMPPQDMLNSLSGKNFRMPIKYRSLSPMVIPIAIFIICFITVYYFIHYVDTYKVQAIEYYGSTDDTQSNQ